MTAKSDELVNELISASIAFGREREPDWQTRIEDARVALCEYIAEADGLEEDSGSYDSLIPDWADKERLISCQSALISMVNQFFYSEAGENVFRHSYMSAEEEAAEYLVEHGIASWTDERKSAISFNKVTE